ncbi:hypothetical protein [uncultured Nostoc sp.]|uniref:hypothetical protein n=1 Tax=uncultured Nostoc sp. TaxID=340711 RepID=UPI0035CBE9D4
MQTQWYLCEIDKCPENEEQRLKKTDNLSVRHPDISFGGSWCVWLPIIPRVGDTLQFQGWQVQVSKVVLVTDWQNETGIKEGLFTSARISIRDDVVPSLMDSHFSIEGGDRQSIYNWEDYARRGNDLQYFAWQLKHEYYIIEKYKKEEKMQYYRWHTRIRPVAGDFIKIKDKRWKVTSVELASANESVDGYLTLEGVTSTN